MKSQEQNAGDLYKMISDETAAREKLGRALQARNPQDRERQTDRARDRYRDRERQRERQRGRESSYFVESATIAAREKQGKALQARHPQR